jgi:hypothetical protein
MPEIRYYVAADGRQPFLLTGGTKRRQQRDIDAAYASWQDYKQSKRRQR